MVLILIVGVVVVAFAIGLAIVVARNGTGGEDEKKGESKENKPQ